jgi:predicted transcriptional regulator
MEEGEDIEMSGEEEMRLLASLDKGIAQLKDGQGVPIEEVRKMVVRWARGDATPSGL